MKLDDLYNHITKHMTPEEALKKLLESSLVNYENLKFEKGKEVHPIMIITFAAWDLGWEMTAFERREDHEQVDGLSVGTKEYMDWVFKKKTKK